MTRDGTTVVVYRDPSCDTCGMARSRCRDLRSGQPCCKRCKHPALPPLHLDLRGTRDGARFVLFPAGTPGVRCSRCHQPLSSAAWWHGAPVCGVCHYANAWQDQPCPACGRARVWCAPESPCCAGCGHDRQQVRA